MIDNKSLLKFFKDNPNPSDKSVHSFAKSKGINEHKFEERVYALLSSFASKGLYNEDPKPLPKKEMDMGKSVEKEHTSDPEIAKRIAKDHVAEIPDYYTRLNEMEEEAEREKKAAFLMGFEKMSAKLLGAEPLKPQKSLVTPEMNTKNRGVIEGTATNKNHKEQITNKKKAPEAQFKVAFWGVAVKGAKALRGGAKAIGAATKAVGSGAKAVAKGGTSMIGDAISLPGKLWGLAKSTRTGKTVGKYLSKDISKTLAKHGLPGAGSAARSAHAIKPMKSMSVMKGWAKPSSSTMKAVTTAKKTPLAAPWMKASFGDVAEYGAFSYATNKLLEPGKPKPRRLPAGY